MVRRAEENKLVEIPQPFVARQRAVMAGAAGDEPTHAVPYEHEFGQRYRPELHQGFEQFGERAPVGGDVKAAVVVQIDGRVRGARASAAPDRGRSVSTADRSCTSRAAARPASAGVRSTASARRSSANGTPP